MWMRITKNLGILVFLMLLIWSGPTACGRADGESGNSDTAVANNGDNDDAGESGSDQGNEDGEDNDENEEDEAVPVEIATLGLRPRAKSRCSRKPPAGSPRCWWKRATSSARVRC